MKIKNPANVCLAILVMTATFSGCTHTLEIKNLNSYHNTSICSLKKPVKIGLRSTSHEIEASNLVHGIGTNLSKYNTRVTTAVPNDNSNLDVVANVDVLSDYKGSGWNFLVNFPGFLVWAPAWHGYNYQVSHNVTVTLSDANNGKIIDTINVPVVLNIRHADINRTWTEISWLEFGVIAFVGGIIFINYDDSITSDVSRKAGPTVTDYIAQRIAASLENYAPLQSVTSAVLTTSSSSVETQLKDLIQLKEKGVITEEEYSTKRKQLIDAL